MKYFKDGNQLCITKNNFINLQESQAVFFNLTFMKIIILLLIACSMLFAFASITYAATADYFVLETIDISAHLTNPQALEVIPGGFVVIDWESDASTFGYILDGQGKLLNATSSGAISKVNLSTEIVGPRITSIRTYTTANSQVNYIILDESNSTFFLLNASSLSYDNLTFRANESWAATDSLVGLCTDKTSTWVAVGNRDVINKLGGLNGTTNLTGFQYAIPGTNNAGGFDCFDGDNKPTIILDDTTGIVYITSNATRVDDSVNLSSLTSQGLNTFSDIALATDPSLHRPDFYALNNNSKLIYHFMKRPPDVLNIFEPDIAFTYPANQQSFNSRFSTVLIQFNFSAEQANNSRSQFDLTADRLNCTLFVNGTANFSMTNTPSNISINNSINVTFEEGSFKTDIRCLANNTFAKQGISKFHTISMSTFRHVFWMGDNFTIYYNSDNNAFQVALGNSSTELSAPFNLTSGEHVNLRITWDNSTGNRTLYIEGTQVASDLSYEWSMNRLDRIYLGSKNDTGQVNGIISYLQISNKAETSKFVKGSFLTAWKDKFLNIADKISSSYFFQFKVALKRSLTSENPILKFVNITYDDTLMNFTIEPDVDFLDFGFSSGDSSAIPAGQTTGGPIFTIWNTGNKTFALQAFSLTPFNSCFTASLFNSSLESGEGLRTSLGNQSLNLSTTPQDFIPILGPGKKTSIFMNVTASGCTPSSEFFDIEFITNP